MAKRYERKYLYTTCKFDWDLVHLINELVFQIVKKEGLFTMLKTDKNLEEIGREPMRVGNNLKQFEKIVRDKLSEKDIKLKTEYAWERQDKPSGSVGIAQRPEYYLWGKPLFTITYLLKSDKKDGGFYGDVLFFRLIYLLLHEGAHLISDYYSLYLLAEGIERVEDLPSISDYGAVLEGLLPERFFRPNLNDERYTKLSMYTNLRWLFQNRSAAEERGYTHTEWHLLNDVWADAFANYVLANPVYLRSIMEHFKVTNPELIEKLFDKDKRTGLYPFMCERDLAYVDILLSGYDVKLVGDAFGEVSRRFVGGVSIDPNAVKALSREYITGGMDEQTLEKADPRERREIESILKAQSEHTDATLSTYNNQVRIPNKNQLRWVFDMAHNWHIVHRRDNVEIIRHKEVYPFKVDLPDELSFFDVIDKNLVR